MSDLDFEDGFEDENGNEGMSEYVLVEGLGNFDGLSGVEEHEGNIIDVRQDDLSHPTVQVEVSDCSASESKFSGTDESDANHTAVLKSAQSEKEAQILANNETGDYRIALEGEQEEKFDSPEQLVAAIRDFFVKPE
ncbi:Uncharacterised protein [Klebsiella pneumoniae]|uniref:hypothetical protein n=1 Tax=Klebsiella pneumoniae TaxID=573 RepID=UPI000E2A4A2E|nr:hypothetical protein [Klebsiella pneumoniae]SVX05451.1 Uncharacterised protein [Klebsiella pneumoniae]